MPTERVRLQGPDGKFYTIPPEQVGKFLRTHPDFNLSISGTPYDRGGTGKTASGKALDISKDLMSDMTKQFQEDYNRRFPPADISTGPHGMGAVKSGLYRARDLVQNNLDAAGGLAGGLLGTVSGGPAAGIGGAALGGGAGRALTQLLRRMEGQSAPATSQQAAVDIGAGGAEQGALEAISTGIGGLGKLIKPKGVVPLIAYATRTGELSPEIAKVLPDIKKAGSPTGAESFVQAVKSAERSLDQEFNQAIFPIAQNPVSAQPVAQEIYSQITSNMPKTSEGQAMRQYLRKRALEFQQGNWTIGSLNKERQLIGQRLSAYHAAEQSGQIHMATVRANIEADRAAESAIKDILYNAADQSGIKPPGYFKALKQRQSALISLRDQSSKNVEKLTKGSVEREGAPLRDKIHIRGHVNPLSGAPGATSGVPMSAFSDPLNTADAAIRKAFPTGTGAGVRAVRQAVGSTLSTPGAVSIPLRSLLLDYSREDQQ